MAEMDGDDRPLEKLVRGHVVLDQEAEVDNALCHVPSPLRFCYTKEVSIVHRQLVEMRSPAVVISDQAARSIDWSEASVSMVSPLSTCRVVI